MLLHPFFCTSILTTFAREYDEIKNSVISAVFLKNEVNLATCLQEVIFFASRAIERIFNPSYLSCKGLLLLNKLCMSLEQRN